MSELQSTLWQAAYDNWQKIWKFIRWVRLTYLPTQPFNIVFAIETDESDSNRGYLQEIIRNFEQQLELLGLSGLLKIKDFKNIKFFKTREEAQKYVEENVIDLLIWGRAGGGVLKKSGDPCCPLDLRFTYLHPKGIKGNIGRMLNAEINSSLATREYWHVLDSESLRDIKIVTDNLTDATLYIISLTMLLFGRVQKSIDILKKLLLKNQGKSDPLLARAKAHLINAYEIELSEMKESSADFQKALMSSHELLKLDSKNLIGLATRAVSYVHFEKYDEAEKDVNELLTLHPSDSVTIIDAAYFSILRKRYSNAIEHYRKLIGLELNFNPLGVAGFLEKQYEKHHDPAFLFGSGFVDWHFGDKTLGKKFLRKFLRNKSVSAEVYKEMRGLASDILNSR